MYEDFASKLAVTAWTGYETPSRDGTPAEITDLDVTIVDGNFPWTLVTVETDAGVTGVGEAFPSPGVREIVTDYLRPVVVGEPPTDVERLYNRMRESLSGRGSQHGVATIAISGVEVALWDAAGKLLDLPVYQLIGGKTRDEVRVYADCHAADAMVASVEAGQAADTYRPDAYAAAAREAVDAGFDLLKFDLDVPSGREVDTLARHLDPAEVDHKRRIVAAVTDAVGDDAEVGFDCHWNFGREAAERLCDAVAPYDPAWIEDPLPPENVDALAALNRAVDVPLLTGENRYGRHGFRELLERDAAAFLAPDLPKTGGIAETKKIADMAEAYYATFVPHNVGSPVATTAAVHLAAATPNVLALEYHAREVAWWDDLVVGDPLIRDGHIRVPDDPGLGVDLDWDVVREHEKTA